MKKLTILVLAFLLGGIVYAEPVALQNGTGTWSQDPSAANWSPQNAITPGEDAWSIEQAPAATDQVAAWETQSDAGFAGGTEFTVRLRSIMISYGVPANKLIGRFKISVTTDVRSSFCDGLSVDGDVDADWVVLDPVSWTVASTSATDLAFTELADHSLLADWTYLPTGTCDTSYTITYYTDLTGITGFRLDTLRDPNLPGGGPGTAYTNWWDVIIGTFWLSEFNVDASLPAGEACVSPPIGDLDGNCWVDLADFALFAQDWLL